MAGDKLSRFNTRFPLPSPSSGGSISYPPSPHPAFLSLSFAFFLSPRFFSSFFFSFIRIKGNPKPECKTLLLRYTFQAQNKNTSLQGYLSTPFLSCFPFIGSRNAPISAICRLHLRIYTHAKGKKKKKKKRNESLTKPKILK